VAVRGSVWRFVVVHCSVWHCVVAWQYVAVRGSVWQCAWQCVW